MQLRDHYLNRRRQVGLGRRNSVDRTRRGVGQRTRPFIELERTGRVSNPLDLSIVCRVLRTGSRVWFGDRRGGEWETFRCSAIELRHRVNKWRRWDSNRAPPEGWSHPALGACTPIQQSVILWWRRRVVKLGPSCTPSSELGLYVTVQRRVSSDLGFSTGRGSPNRQWVGQRRRWESNPLYAGFAGSRLAVWLQRQLTKCPR